MNDKIAGAKHDVTIKAELKDVDPKSAGIINAELNMDGAKSKSLKNIERKNANISLVLLMIGIALIALPFMIKGDMMDWGFASVWVGTLLSLSSLFAYWIYIRRARVRRGMISGEKILAHWIFSEARQEANKKDALETHRDSRTAAKVFGGILFSIGLVVYLLDTRRNGAYFILMSAISIVLMILIYLFTWRYYKRISEEQSSVTFAPEGVYHLGNLIHWDGLITKLESVLLDPLDSGSLVVVYNQVYGRVQFRGRHVLKVPIPQGKEGEAIQIIEAYGRPADGKLMKYLKDLEGKYE